MRQASRRFSRDCLCPRRANFEPTSCPVFWKQVLRPSISMFAPRAFGAEPLGVNARSFLES